MAFRYTKNLNKTICLEVTDKCGLNCAHCSSNSNIKKNTFLSFNKISRIIEESARLGFNEISLSGGDPLLHPKIDKIIKLAKQYSFYVICYTSGNLYNRREQKNLPLSKEFFKKLDKSGLDKLVFSLHGISKDSHEEITQVSNSYMNLLISMENSKNDYVFKREVNFVIMKNNANELFKVVPFLRKFNIFNLHLLRFIPHGRAFNNRVKFELDDTEVKTLIQDFISEYGEKIGISLSSSLPILKQNDRIKCRAGTDKICITPYGYVYPCVALKNIKLNGDNNIETNLLSIIISDSKVFKFMNSIHKSNQEYECHLNCPAQKIIKEQLV